MAFEPKKFSELYEAMRSRTTVLTDFEVGSVTRTVYESFAFELGLLYQKMNLVYLSGFVDSAEGTHLDQVVAVLGIQRNLPDFAVGEVSFLRDKGNSDIPIPAGTLVSTEDKPEQPKKVYQTIESAVLSKDQPEVTVKVQAITRGEEQDSDPEQIAVMPRPIPGIKSVNNGASVKLLGRRRETDDELRRRAKNALLSSGKANLASLENAVLSLPGILDVKVREDFHFAKGLVTLTRAGGPADIVPKGSTISAGEKAPFLPYKLAQDVVFDNDDKVETGQIVSLLEGKQGELLPGSPIKFDDSKFSAYTLSYTDAIRQSKFGMAEVIVDAPDFDKVKAQVLDAVENVRAAGVFVSVTEARKIILTGVFRIEPAAQLNLNDDERIDFEENIRQELILFFQSVKMGQPVLFSKMMKAVLSVDGVEDLSEFRINTLVTGPTGTISQVFQLGNNKIEADELERFYPKHLCVASEPKLLKVNVVYKANELTKEKTNEVENALDAYFSSLSSEEPIERSDVQNAIDAALGVTVTALKIQPVSWCPDPDETVSDDAPNYTYKFVEKPTKGNVFGYVQELEIGGALLLILQNKLTVETKAEILEQAEATIASYMNSLAPEDDVVIDDLISQVKSDNRVLDVKFSEDDLVVTIKTDPATIDPNRLSAGKVDVKTFEKAVFNSSAFVVATEISNVDITVNKINIKISQPTDAETPKVDVVALTPTIKAQVAHTVDSFLVGYIPGQDLSYNDLKGAIMNLSFGVSFTMTELSLHADSVAGFADQDATSAAPQDIKVREIELAVMKPMALDKISVS